MADEKTFENTPDALFRFAMSEDGMTLGVSRYFPPKGGRGPSVELIREQLAAAGVRLPLDEEAAERVVEAAREDRPCTGIALIRGTPPEEPRHGALIALGDLEYPVFPQDRFARYRPPRTARPGETIDGRPLPTQEEFKPEDVEVTIGENVDWDPTTESYVSRVWGIARLTGGVITVDPIPNITEDEIAVIGTIHHKNFQGNPVTPAMLEKEMRDMGVVADPDPDILDAKIRQAAGKKSPLFEQIIVQGKHPVPGRDGWIEFLVSTREETGTEDEAGRIDFRDKGSHPMVKPGQAIARYHHPTAGEGGIDLYGKTIPAHAGRELHIHLGENVILLDDGVTYQSKAEGVVVMSGNELSVTECLEISSNVDLNSGNVKVEHGSIKIRGSIQAGFTVSAPNHVIVEGSIESASVHAGGMVEVHGGILMPEGGEVYAGNDVTANYAINANIRAGGDVIIANETSNSTIQCGGKFISVSGKGAILGGQILTGKGAEVNEIGSELGVQTLVGIDIEHPEDQELQQQRAKITQAIRKIDEALGDDPPEVILMRTPEAKREAVSEVLSHRRTLIRRRKAITDQIHKLLDARQRELRDRTVKARQMIYPGTSIQFGEKTRLFAKRCEASTLYWDVGNQTIAIK